MLRRTLPALLLLAPALASAQDEEGPDTRGLVHRAEGAWEGYTLIAPLTSTRLYLIDLAGEVVHTWDPPMRTMCAILLDDGNLLRWGVLEDDERRFQGPGVTGGIVETIDWDGNVLWHYELTGDEELLHHDIALLPSGNVLIVAWEYRSREEAIAAGRDPEQVDERGMWPDVVHELRPTPPLGAEVVWTWRAWDHLVQDFDGSKANFGSPHELAGRIDLNADHRGSAPMTAAQIEAQRKLAKDMSALGYGGGDDGGEEPMSGSAPDWLHTNAIDHLPEHDLIVLSVPALNELWVIDHSTTTEEAAGSTGGRFGRGGDLLWRWGNPRNYGAGKGRDQQLSFQHDPTWQASEEGTLRLVVFNNGRLRKGGKPYSSVDELVVPFDPAKGFPREPGKPFGPAAPAWSYSEPGTFYSSFISGAQRLPNGNTLICSGAQGRVFEVTRSGEVVWDYRNPLVGEVERNVPANSLYRAVRFPKDHAALAERLR